VATGHSIDVDSLSPGKDQRTELQIAEEDARRSIALQAAMAVHPDVDEDSYDLNANIAGFHTAATYKLDKRTGLFLIGIVKKEGVRVEIVFNPKKARIKAIASFDASQFKEAAKRLAVLTGRGVQDAETVAYARAASWHVNLDAGVTGDARTAALNGLGHFYLDRGEYEPSIRMFYQLYDVGPDSPAPSRELLQTLVDLARKTHRDGTASKFQAEIDRRWPATQPAAAPTSLPSSIRDAHLEQPFAALLANDELLLSMGGAAVVRENGASYFIAVGTTPVNGDSPDERLRQIKVGQVHAQREAVTFADQETIVVHVIEVDTTTITKTAGQTTVHVSRVHDSTITAKVHGIVKGMQPAGTWKSTDGTVFYYALAIKMD